MSISTDVLLPYSSNDFFYIRAEELKIPIDATSCSIAQNKNCDIVSSSNYTACLQKEFCNNKSYANTLPHD